MFDKIYGSTFYMAIRFDTFHGIASIRFLSGCLFRLYFDHFTRERPFVDSEKIAQFGRALICFIKGRGSKKEDLPGYLIMVAILYGVTFLGLIMLNKVGVNIPFLLQTWPYTYFFYVRQSVIIMLFTNYVVGVVLVYFKLKLSVQKRGLNLITRQSMFLPSYVWVSSFI
eukprot:gene12628-26591_t